MNAIATSKIERAGHGQRRSALDPDFFGGRTHGAFLSQVVVGFCATFLVAAALYALLRYVAFRRPLPWSNQILPLLIAAAFWAPFLLFVISELELLAACCFTCFTQKLFVQDWQCSQPSVL